MIPIAHLPRALCALACSMAFAAQPCLADDATLNVRLQTESVDTVMSRSTRSFELAELRWQAKVPGQNTLRGGVTARHDSGASDGALRINELALERPLVGGFLTAGKKVMSWDVGYAFRPLDVVQQEDRRALNPVTQNGVPMLAWEAFDASRAITIVLTNPQHGAARADQPRADGALAVRLYRQDGSTDQYAVLRLSQRNGVEGGASFSHVVNEALEWHASLLLQQRHDRWLPGGVGSSAGGSTGNNIGGSAGIGGSSAAFPLRAVRQDGGGKALTGFTWTTESKWSVLGEAWLDRTVQHAQQRNALLRVAHTMGDGEISGDVLWQRGSRIASLAASWKPGPWLLSASLRHFDGAAGMVVKTVAVASVQYAY